MPAVQIRPTPVAGRAAALRLVFQNLSHEVRERQVEASAAALDGIDPEDAGLFEAIEGGGATGKRRLPVAGAGHWPTSLASATRETAANCEPIGAIWVQLMPGRVGSIWPPQTLNPAPAEEASPLPALSACRYDRHGKPASWPAKLLAACGRNWRAR